MRSPSTPGHPDLPLFLLLLPVLVTLAGCASGGGERPSGGLTALATVQSAVYERSQSMELSIDAGGQVLPVTVSDRSVLEVSFRPEGSSTRVSATVRSFEGRMTNPIAPTLTADASQIQGPVVFLLDPRGRPTVVSLPTTSGAAEQLFDGTQLAHEFGPRLPGRSAPTGSTWTDTIAYAVEGAGGMNSTVQQVVRYTVAGDTVVDGRSYLLIRGEGEDRIAQSGVTGGMQVSQDLNGTSVHMYFWDTGAGILHSGRVESTLIGSMTADVAPIPLAVRARGTATIQRR